jgi:hypothetical protein
LTATSWYKDPGPIPAADENAGLRIRINEIIVDNPSETVICCVRTSDRCINVTRTVNPNRVGINDIRRNRTPEQGRDSSVLITKDTVVVDQVRIVRDGAETQSPRDLDDAVNISINCIVPDFGPSLDLDSDASVGIVIRVDIAINGIVRDQNLAAVSSDRGNTETTIPVYDVADDIQSIHVHCRHSGIMYDNSRVGVIVNIISADCSVNSVKHGDAVPSICKGVVVDDIPAHLEISGAVQSHAISTIVVNLIAADDFVRTLRVETIKS